MPGAGAPRTVAALSARCSFPPAVSFWDGLQTGMLLIGPPVNQLDAGKPSIPAVK
jgi:hypothetical protein